MKLGLIRILHNGCELSGRGSLPHKALQEPATPLSLASGAESLVRSSELLGRFSDSSDGSSDSAITARSSRTSVFMQVLFEFQSSF